ncbi:hypothetical protein BKA61DRAFT_320781 [Leptodontidium sp. MPI-SDFR-AT-0119]|nr:hypothetical protein BKA61DRAFT_320781 [Leptodontidium sp. MPI-SDFR-AT-0119]
MQLQHLPSILPAGPQGLAGWLGSHRSHRQIDSECGPRNLPDRQTDHYWTIRYGVCKRGEGEGISVVVPMSIVGRRHARLFLSAGRNSMHVSEVSRRKASRRPMSNYACGMYSRKSDWGLRCIGLDGVEDPLPVSLSLSCRAVPISYSPFCGQPLGPVVKSSCIPLILFLTYRIFLFLPQHCTFFSIAISLYSAWGSFNYLHLLTHRDSAIISRPICL